MKQLQPMQVASRHGPLPRQHNRHSQSHQHGHHINVHVPEHLHLGRLNHHHCPRGVTIIIIIIIFIFFSFYCMRSDKGDFERLQRVPGSEGG